ncbi:MAG TPA: alpha/beta hydrolase [Anaerolineales bacterium]|nr:alpha/beta hydrolase [Anaerolineales bacterium]
MKKINWKIVAAVITAVLLVLVAGFVFWASDASAATDVALQALNSDSKVNVSAENGWVIFTPAENSRPETGFIFYPGGKVDYRAYAPILKMISAKGYFVAVVPVPLNLAFFDINAASRVEAAYPEVKNWFVGGHSLGGVAASSYAASHDEIRGVVFWASYPADDSLKTKNIPAVSIYGTNDGLATGDKLDASKALLLEDTKFVPIDGGNHAQFGSYGPQAGDNEATISPEDQWIQATDATVAFFAEVLK